MCSNPTTDAASSSDCQCDHLFLYEPPYDASQMGQQFCAKDTNHLHQVYISQTRSLIIKYFYRTNHTGDVFKLDYISERRLTQKYPVAISILY